VVGRGNGVGGGAPYKVYPCCNKSLGTQLSNIFIKLENCILEDIYLHYVLVMSQRFIGLIVSALAGLTG
jgi:hypothetical protein